MHPTPDEQLRAIRRLVDGAAADPAIAPESEAMLTDASRLLRRLERSWARRLPFLVRDNELSGGLLAELAPQLSADLAAEIEVVTTSLPVNDEAAAHEMNKRLQGLLGQAGHLLPDDADGDAGRARIADHLRARLAADPALNRTPADRPPVEDSSP